MMDQPPHISIQYDRGGAVGDYVGRISWARQAMATVRIDGQCFSSCTLWTSLPKNKVCVTKRAVLGFHAAYTTADGQTSMAATGVMYAYYPPEVNGWLAERGGLTSDMKYLEGAELRSMFKECP